VEVGDHRQFEVTGSCSVEATLTGFAAADRTGPDSGPSRDTPDRPGARGIALDDSRLGHALEIVYLCPWETWQSDFCQTGHPWMQCWRLRDHSRESESAGAVRCSSRAPPFWCFAVVWIPRGLVLLDMP
jgi:hypothetical protein